MLQYVRDDIHATAKKGLAACLGPPMMNACRSLRSHSAGHTAWTCPALYLADVVLGSQQCGAQLQCTAAAAATAGTRPRAAALQLPVTPS